MSQRAALVSDSCLETFLHCRYKSYLKVGNTTGQLSDFERHTAARGDAYRQLVQSRLLPRYREADVLQSPPMTFQTLQKGKALILDAKAQAASLSATIDVLQRAGDASLLGDFLYQPVQLCYYDLPTRAATILLAFKSLVIGELQGQIPAHGTMIYGAQLHCRTVKLGGLQKLVRRMVADIQAYSGTLIPFLLSY